MIHRDKTTGSITIVCDDTGIVFDNEHEDDDRGFQRLIGEIREAGWRVTKTTDGYEHLSPEAQRGNVKAQAARLGVPIGGKKRKRYSPEIEKLL